MKKLSFMAVSALLVLGLASCKKNSDVQNPESKKGMVTTEFSAISSESKEKTSISDADILWSEGDQIKIYAGTETSGNDFTLTEGEGTTSAKFEGLIAEIATAPYYAVYPSSQALSIDGSVIKFGIPAEQAYVENSFATNTVPMVAYSAAGKSLAFKNQTAFIKLQLTGAGTIATMEIESASNNICGTFSVSKTNPKSASTAVTGAKKITVTNISGTELDDTTPKNVIIALAPANFAADDLTLSMTSSDGGKFTTKLGGVNVGRSQGKAVDVLVEFVMPPTKGTAKRTGDIDVEWVQLWAGGPKWAVYNIGASSVGEYGFYLAWGGTKDKGTDDCRSTKEIQYGTYDTAKNLWGSNWQMPKKTDYQNLINNCDFKDKSAQDSGYGVAGRLYTGKGVYSGNSVFFPAAGTYEYSAFENVGRYGNYWSSTPGSSYRNNQLSFLVSSTYQVVAVEYGDRDRSVRAILHE